MTISYLKHPDLEVVVGKLTDKMGPFSLFVDLPFIKEFASAHPDAVFATFGFVIIGGLFSAALRTRTHDRFLASFNHDVLRPVRSLAFDLAPGSTGFVQLRWQLGGNSLRRAAWDQLEEWCRESAEALKEGHSDKRLRFAVLVGSSGSGKSRLAHELARSLARRDLLGGAEPTAVAGWRVGCYARQVLSMRRRSDDPWDAGVLEKREGDLDFEHFCARVEDWRPRRPTILLLDDPLPHWTGWVRQALIRGNQKKPFDHVVCLLVVNQTVPADAGLHYDATSRQWFADEAPAVPQPIMLPRTAWFTQKEAVRAAFDTGLFWSSINAQSDIRNHLFRVTNGNPLLVETAIEQRWTGDQIAEMTANGPLEARARRIVVGLKSRDITRHAQFVTLALATLVGGGRREVIEEQAKSILSPFVPLPDDLQGCFPTEPLGVGADAQIPAVRPDLIADAFLDHVLKIIGEERGLSLAQVAFKLAPSRMLREIGRARRTDSPIARALVDIARDPAGVPGVNSLDLALALAEMAAFYDPDDRPLSTAESRTAALQSAIEAIARLDPAMRLAFGAAFARLCELPPELGSRQIRASAVIALLNASTMPDATPSTKTWVRVFKALERSAHGLIECPENLKRSASLIQEVEQLAEIADLSWAMGWEWRVALGPMWDALANAASERSAHNLARRLQAMAAIGQPEKARAAADGVASQSAQAQDDPIIAREAAATRYFEAYAWSLDPTDAQALAVQASADMIAMLAERFPDDLVIANWAAAARRCEAYAWSKVPAGAQALAARKVADVVATLAERFVDSAEVASDAAAARQFEAYAWSQVPAGAQAPAVRAAADLAGFLADRFADDPTIAIEAASARQYEAYAWSQVPGGAQALAVRAAADVVAALANRFTKNSWIARQAAYARQHEAKAWSDVPTGAQVLAVRAAADCVATLAERFTDHPEIASNSTAARQWEAYAWGQVPAGAQALAARVAADMVAVSAERFTDNLGMLSHAAFARQCEAYAWSQVPAGAQALAARTAADMVATQAKRFPHNLEIAKLAASARRYEAYAWSEVPAGAQALAARTAADMVALVVEPFTSDPNIACEVARSRIYEADAWSKVPAGAQALAARAAADVVATLAERFADEPTFAYWAAHARQAEAFAWGAVPAGAQALAARAAADAVAVLSERFADDPTIAYLAASARRSEANAWSKIPAGVQAPAARAAADVVAILSDRFANDPTIAYWAATARQSEAFAWGEIPAGAQALAARAAADAVAVLAERFADDPTIAYLAANARQSETYAWCQVPAGAQAAAARSAATAVAKLAERFASEPGIANIAGIARTHEAYAWSQVPRPLT